MVQALKEARQLPTWVKVQRITFDEITKRAVLAAIAAPRDIDMDLVNAQQARRALDYLVGFTLSPVLWRKLPGSRSAGRVQSVALRLICERDAEIEQFIAREYWDITVALDSAKNATLEARLFEYKGEKMEKFSITNETQATAIAADLRGKQFSVAKLEEKQVRRHPAPPFTTSTLQQEAARKLGFSAKKTMQLAQKLYEGVTMDGETAGLITYMRTDGVNVSQEAVSAAREYIGSKIGQDYVPASPRAYKTKAKNAQEAHEAIRPTEVSRTPQTAARFLDNDMARLYELIWKRMVASQMESALFDQLIVDIAAQDKQAVLRATGSVVRFDGFLTLYQEGRDEEDDSEENRKLPALTQGESLATKDVTPAQHFTEPPPRYSEASLVKKLEELGIGRPSTYAAILSVLQDRNYVRLDKKRFVAESLGRIVSAFLVSFFTRYVEYDFTADMETKLDDVSAGEREWKAVLREFWGEFINKIEESKQLSITQVLEAIDTLLESFLFGAEQKGVDPRACPACGKGRLGVRLGRYGAYIGCSAYPDCNYKRQVGEATGGAEGEAGDGVFPRTLGLDPETGDPVTLRKGPYGMYVQRGEGKAPKRASLLKGMQPDAITLEVAITLLKLPRELGMHPDTGKPIMAGVGRFGPYLQHDGKFTSLPPEEEVLQIGINRAVEVLAQAAEKSKSGKGGGAGMLRSLGDHPDGGSIGVYKGRYGPYIKYGKINATLPKDADPEQFTLEEALSLIDAKGGSAAAGKKKPAKKAAAKKPAAKPVAEKKAKVAVKKPAAKKAAGKKKA